MCTFILQLIFACITLSFDVTTPELNNVFEAVTIENLHVVFETTLLYQFELLHYV